MPGSCRHAQPPAQIKARVDAHEPAHEPADQGWTLADGTPLRLRAVRATDAVALGALLGSLDATARRRRFHCALNHTLAQTRERKDTRWTGIFAVSAARPWCEAGDFARCAALLDEADRQLHASMPKTHPILAFLLQERARLALDGRPRPCWRNADRQGADVPGANGLRS